MKLSEILDEMNFIEYNVCMEKSFDNMSFLLPNRKERNRCVFLSEKKYIKKLDQSVKMVITTQEMVTAIIEKDIGVCVVADPRLVFYQVHNYLSSKAYYLRNSFQTKIGAGCRIDPSAIIPQKNIIIGDRVVIEDRVTLAGFVEIGDDSIIHSGSVIGAPGNDFKRFGEKLVRIVTIGGIKLGSGVEIDHNCCIERPTFSYENTVFGNETKVGALSFISHGVRVGERTQIKGMVNIAGYATIGNDVFVGPGSTISSVISIGDNAHVTLGSVVASSISPGSHVTGNFAVDHNKFMAQQMNILRNVY